MKNFMITMIIICAVAAVIFLAITAPVPGHFWLWVAGLAGPLVGVFQFVLDHARKFFEQPDHTIRRTRGSAKHDKKIRTL